MTYDDPDLSEFRGYFKAKEPRNLERAEARATAADLHLRRIGSDKGGHWEVL